MNDDNTHTDEQQPQDVDPIHAAWERLLLWQLQCEIGEQLPKSA